MSDKPANPVLTPPLSPKSEHGVRPTTVWFVQGKKANKAFRSALALHREETSISETHLPKTHDEKENPQHDVPEKAGYDAHLVQH